MTKNAKSDSWLRLHFLVVAIGLGGFLIWAFVAPLKEGIASNGHIIVEQNRKSLQHLEGGIVREIYVAEGDTVEAGDVLFEIDALAATANRDQIAFERAERMANADRLNALLNGARRLEFPSRPDWTVSEDAAVGIANEQLNLFMEQSDNHRTRLELLRRRIDSFKVGEIERDEQIIAINNSLEAIESELTLTQNLVDEKLAEASILYRLQRERARLQSDKSGLNQQILEIGSKIAEVETEMLQTRSDFREHLLRELLETRTAIALAEEKLKAMEDAVYRSRVLAPNSGQVLNLVVTTIGGVVRPGETMLEIVPETSGAWAAVQILPNDRDAVSEGMEVRVRMSGFQSWQTPDIAGEVVTVSADLKEIPQTGMTFYEARILLDREDLQAANLPPIQPGMPVSAFITTQKDRTLADYLIEPIYAHFRKGLSSG